MRRCLARSARAFHLERHIAARLVGNEFQRQVYIAHLRIIGRGRKLLRYGLTKHRLELPVCLVEVIVLQPHEMLDEVGMQRTQVGAVDSVGPFQVHINHIHFVALTIEQMLLDVTHKIVALFLRHAARNHKLQKE